MMNMIAHAPGGDEQQKNGIGACTGREAQGERCFRQQWMLLVKVSRMGSEREGAAIRECGAATPARIVPVLPPLKVGTKSWYIVRKGS